MNQQSGYAVGYNPVPLGDNQVQINYGQPIPGIQVQPGFNQIPTAPGVSWMPRPQMIPNVSPGLE